MKGEKMELWKKAPNALGSGPTDMNANEILKGAGGTTMAVGSGDKPGESEKAPGMIGHDAKNITMKGVENKMPEKASPGAGGGYKVGTGNTVAKTSKMAQKVGSPRKGH